MANKIKRIHSKFPKISYHCSHCEDADQRNTRNLIVGKNWCAGCGHRTGLCKIEGVRTRFKADPYNSKYVIFRKVMDFGRGKNRARGAWMVRIESGWRSLYVSCGRCGAINDLSNANTQNGYCECFHCGRCGCDHFVRLDGFEMSKYPPFKRLDHSIRFEGGRVVDRIPGR